MAASLPESTSAERSAATTCNAAPRERSAAAWPSARARPRAPGAEAMTPPVRLVGDVSRSQRTHPPNGGREPLRSG